MFKELTVWSITSLSCVLANLQKSKTWEQFSVSLLQYKVCHKYFLINYIWSTEVCENLLKNKLGQFKVMPITTSLPLTCISTCFLRYSHGIHSEVHITHSPLKSDNTHKRTFLECHCQVTSHKKTALMLCLLPKLFPSRTQFWGKNLHPLLHPRQDPSEHFIFWGKVLILQVMNPYKGFI